MYWPTSKGTVHRGATYQVVLSDRLRNFSACWRTTEGQRATKIHLAQMVLLRVAKKDLSWYLYCFMGVKSHSVQIRYSKPRGMHIITKADAVNPDGCTLLKRFYGCLFHTSSVWMNILTCRLARSYRNQSYKRQDKHIFWNKRLGEVMLSSARLLRWCGISETYQTRV